MKKILTALTVILTCANLSLASEIENANTKEQEFLSEDAANQIIEMEDNKVIVIVQKQPLNEKSNQKIKLKRNWLGVYVQINGKVKVNPLANTYEIQ